VTHQFLAYLKTLDRWTRNEWIYQLLERLIILDCWTGSEWDISAYRVHDDISFWKQSWVLQRRTYIPPNYGIAGWSISQCTKIYVRHQNVHQNHNTNLSEVWKISNNYLQKKNSRPKSHSRRNEQLINSISVAKIWFCIVCVQNFYKER